MLIFAKINNAAKTIVFFDLYTSTIHCKFVKNKRIMIKKIKGKLSILLLKINRCATIKEEVENPVEQSRLKNEEINENYKNIIGIS
jgi:hypothetical protein